MANKRNIRVRRTAEVQKKSTQSLRMALSVAAKIAGSCKELAHTSLRAMRETSFSTYTWVLAACVLTGGGVWLSHAVRHHATFALREIRWSGLSKLVGADLQRAVGLPLGVSVVALSTSDVQIALRRNPWVAQARVEKRLPNTLHIAVRERYPVALVKFTKGEQWLTQDGEVIDQPPPFSVGDLPEVSGWEETLWQTDMAYRLAMIMTTVSLLRDHEAWSDPSQAIASLAWTDEDSVILVLLDGTRVHLGQGAYLAKIKRLATLLKGIDHCRTSAQTIYLDHDQRPGWATLRFQ